MNFTEQELIDELLQVAEVQPRPLESDGWLRFTSILNSVRDSGITSETLRRSLLQRVLEGKLEQKKYGKDMYYRKIVV